MRRCARFYAGKRRFHCRRFTRARAVAFDVIISCSSNVYVSLTFTYAQRIDTRGRISAQIDAWPEYLRVLIKRRFIITKSKKAP